MKTLEKRIEEIEFSGVIHIERGNEILFSEAYGYRDIPNQLPNLSNTRFGIASGTKTFTAIGILKLVDQGLLSLDTPVVEVMKEIGCIDEKATIQQLLNHSSGVFDYYDEELVEDFDNFSVEIPWFQLETPSDYLPLFQGPSMKFPAGERVSYSNGGYVLLGAIIERLSGQSYRDFMEKEIFKPLEMNCSGFYAFNALPANTAWGYMNLEEGLNNIYQLPIRGGGDGGLYTNAPDLNTFWTSLFQGRILSSSSLQALSRKETVIYGSQEYGLGLYIGAFQGEPFYFADGCDAGVGFHSCCFPDRQIRFHILSNLTDGHEEIREGIFGELKNLIG